MCIAGSATTALGMELNVELLSVACRQHRSVVWSQLRVRATHFPFRIFGNSALTDSTTVGVIVEWRPPLPSHSRPERDRTGRAPCCFQLQENESVRGLQSLERLPQVPLSVET